MVQSSVEYRPRDPFGSVLHRIVRDHLETFRAEAAHLRDGEGLPRFVEEESRAFLHVHALVLDGVFARDEGGRLRFCSDLTSNGQPLQPYIGKERGVTVSCVVVNDKVRFSAGFR